MIVWLLIPGMDSSLGRGRESLCTDARDWFSSFMHKRCPDDPPKPMSDTEVGRNLERERAGSPFVSGRPVRTSFMQEGGEPIPGIRVQAFRPREESILSSPGINSGDQLETEVGVPVLCCMQLEIYENTFSSSPTISE